MVQSRQVVLPLLIASMLITITSAFCSIDVNADPSTLSIDSVEYQEGMVTIAGSVSSDSIHTVQIRIVGEGLDESPYDFTSVVNGQFQDVFPIVLSPGIYQVQVFLGDNSSVTRDFLVEDQDEFVFTMVETTILDVNSRISIYNLVALTPLELFDQLHWDSSNPDVATISDGYLTGISSGTADIQASLTINGESHVRICHVTVYLNSQPEDPNQKEYSFWIQAKLDSDIACIGTNYSASDLRQGLMFVSHGENAANALEKACQANGIPVELGNRKGTEGWVVHLFNVGDEQQPDGTWKYWVQYHDGKYNDWTLGHYTDGGEFKLIYTITAEIPQAKTGLHYTGNDIEGVPGGPGYTVVGGIAKDVGTYTATATLTDAEYMWTDGTVEPKTLVWYILDDGSTPDNPDVPEVPSEHLDPDDQGVVVEHDSKTNDDGTVTEITTVTKTDESGNEVTTTISTTTYGDGTVEEIRSTPNTEVSDGVKTESILETVTIKDGNGSIVSETNITVSIVDNTASNAESKGISIYASDENANVTVSANAIEGSTSAIVVTDIKAAESNGQLEISDEALELALKMQGLYSKKIIEYSESVDTSEKVIQVKTDSSEAQVSLDSEAMKKVSDSNAAFRMSTSKGSITVEKDTLSGLSQREEVTLSFSPADRSSMTSAQREVIEAGSTVVSLTATSAGLSIGSDLGGKVTVTVKHAAVDGKTPVAYYVDGNGNRTKVAEQHYDAEKEEMTMVLDHFSIYTIVDESPAGEELPVTVLVMTAVIVLICLGILLPQVVGRKQ